MECHQISKDSFELVITSSDNVESIKKRVEAQHGLLADSHSLMWQGKRLSASKSLASYGVGSGSVLELVPVEPAQPASLPDGSPMLSSPQHELVRSSCAEASTSGSPKHKLLYILTHTCNLLRPLLSSATEDM